MSSGLRREREEHDRLQNKYNNLHEKYRNEKLEWLKEKKQLNSKINHLEEHIEKKKINDLEKRLQKKPQGQEWLTTYRNSSKRELPSMAPELEVFTTKEDKSIKTKP